MLVHKQFLRFSISKEICKPNLNIEKFKQNQYLNIFAKKKAIVFLKKNARLANIYRSK
jgi:hypothetical protein